MRIVRPPQLEKVEGYAHKCSVITCDDGNKYVASELAAKLGITHNALRLRFRLYGWEPEDILAKDFRRSCPRRKKVIRSKKEVIPVTAKDREAMGLLPVKETIPEQTLQEMALALLEEAREVVADRFKTHQRVNGMTAFRKEMKFWNDLELDNVWLEVLADLHGQPTHEIKANILRVLEQDIARTEVAV